jgi:putative RNA 2'-phosphotransferase
MAKKLVKLSKFIAYMLRHDPEGFDLQLDKEGFTDLDAVWGQVIKKHNNHYSRQDLSTTVERASNVAARHGKPVLLEIRALAAHNAGHVFHHPEDQHYLVRAVPPEFIDFPEA